MTSGLPSSWFVDQMQKSSRALKMSVCEAWSAFESRSWSEGEGGGEREDDADDDGEEGEGGGRCDRELAGECECAAAEDQSCPLVRSLLLALLRLLPDDADAERGVAGSVSSSASPETDGA